MLFFLSYAHDDDKTLNPKSRGWVSYFMEALVLELTGSGHSGDVKIWRDENERVSGTLSKKLADGIRSSDGLLSVVSPVYGTRPYCHLEIAEFVNKKGSEPIIIVAKRPFAKDSLPEEIRDHLFVKFYRSGPDPDDFKPYFEGYGTASLSNETEFWDKIRTVVKEITRLAKTPVEPERYKATAFLNFTVGNLAGERARLAQELRNLRIRVLPEGDLPRDSAALETIVRQAADEADFAIHLLDQTNPVSVADATDSVDAIQLAVTAERYDTVDGFQRFIWPGEDPSLMTLKHRPDKDHVIMRKISVFIDTVLKRLDQELKKGKPLASVPGTGARLMLVCHSEDADTAAMISHIAVAMGGLVEPALLDAGMPENLPQSGDSLVICWSTAPVAEIKRLIDLAKAQQTCRVGIFRLNPDSPEQKLFGHPGLEFNEVLTNDSEQIRTHLEKLLET